MPVGKRADPYKNFRFLVEIDGIVQAGFLECSGMGGSTDVIEYRVGNEPSVVRKLAGLKRFSNIVLRWGLTDSMDMMDWYKLVEQGKMSEARRNMAVILLDDEGNPASRWEVVGAWPCRWVGPLLHAKGQEIAIETLEIAHEGIRRTA